MFWYLFFWGGRKLKILLRVHMCSWAMFLLYACAIVIKTFSVDWD